MLPCWLRLFQPLAAKNINKLDSMEVSQNKETTLLVVFPAASLARVGCSWFLLLFGLIQVISHPRLDSETSASHLFNTVP